MQTTIPNLTKNIEAAIEDIRSKFIILDETEDSFTIIKKGFQKHIPRYKGDGDIRKPNPYQKYTNKKWTTDESEWTWEQHRKYGLSNLELSLALYRSICSINKHVKTLKKRYGVYNEKHKGAKDNATTHFMNYMISERKVKTVLDVYAGMDAFYKKFGDILNVTTNDIIKWYDTTHNMKDTDLMAKILYEKTYYDIIDLDAYGSAAPALDIALQRATKGIIITVGELGSKRMSRLDYVDRWYGINRMEDFTLTNIENKIIKFAERHNKKLEIFDRVKLGDISRVYFTIDKFEIKAQKKQVHIGLDLTIYERENEDI